VKDSNTGRLVSSQQTYLELATKAYHEQIRSQSAQSGARTYLDKHAITDWGVVEKYQLGYVAEPMKGDERFRGMLAIPYLGPTGTIAMKFRRLEGAGGKYAKHTGERNRLYNVAAYFNADHVIGLVEGEIDAVVATERLGIPTMGIPGVDSWQARANDWRPIFKDFRLVVVFTDGDNAGEGLGDSVAESLGYRARIIACDKGEDVASMVKAGKADALRALASE
jgi:hypothetical protein